MEKKLVRSLAGITYRLGAFFFLCLNSTSHGIESQFISALRERDSLQLLIPIGAKQPPVAGLYASFIMTTHDPRDPGQGTETNRCEAAWTKDWCVLKILTDYEKEPVFRPRGTRNYQSTEYDSDGNLILWRSLERYCLSSKERNDTFEKLASYTVSPQQNTLARFNLARLWRFRMEDRNNLFIFDQFRLATGWGFGGQLQEITSTNAVSSLVLAMIEAEGINGPSLRGNWKIWYDREDLLIRKAEFFHVVIDRAILETNNPSTVVTNVGVVECPGLRIARSGMYKVGPYEFHFQVLRVNSLDRTEGEADRLYQEVTDRVTSPLPQNSEIFDRRGVEPKRIFPSE